LKKIFSEANLLYSDGKFSAAIEKLDNLLLNYTLSLRIKLSIRVLKSLSLSQEKKHDEALEIADSIIKVSKKNNFNLNIVDGLLSKAAIENDRGDLNKSIANKFELA